MQPGESLFHKVNDIPLKYKFLLIYLLCVLIPIIAINLFFFQQNSANIRIREEENLRKSIERASGELQSMIEESVAVSHAIAGDQPLYEALDRSYENPVAFYEVYDSFLRDKLKRYMSAYPNILEVGIYTDNATIDSGDNYHVIDERVEKQGWLSGMDLIGGGFRVAAYVDNIGLNPSKRISVVSMLNEYPNLAEYRKYLRIDLNMSKIYGILDREKDSLQLQLIDDQNRIVATGDGKEEQNAPIQHYKPAPSRPGSVIERNLGKANYIHNWKLVGTADTRRIDGLLSDLRRSIISLAVISTFIPSLLIFIILRSYHYRVKKLSRHMEKVRNEKFDLISLHEGRDEIGGLIRAFNVMTLKINSLINDVYKLEIRNKSMELERVRAEMNLLQSQMNPHFLFNTLNALLVVCTQKGYNDVTDIIKSLSQLLRRLLSWSDDLTPLQEELQFTGMYLQIEKFRFGDRIDYVFEVDPQAVNFRIPKMSIQPLVENACKHGLQAMKGKGFISISVAILDRDLVVTVSDNGAGIEEDRLQQLQRAIHSDTEMEGHVGIRNVYRRLELYYHENVRFRMTSELGKGTTAGFSIPLHRLGLENE